MLAKAAKWDSLAAFLAMFATANKQKRAARSFPPRSAARSGGKEPRHGGTGPTRPTWPKRPPGTRVNIERVSCACPVSGPHGM